MSLNQVYLSYLATHPLATKSATAAILATLNEGIATSVSGFGKGSAVTKKMAQMLLYAAFFATPLSHLYYNQLTRIFKGKLTWKLKMLQILASLLTLSPVLSAAFVSWISAINMQKKETLSNYRSVIINGLKNNFWLVYRSSAITSTLSMAVAQALVPTELWVVFFNAVYFVLGTYQNTKMKLKARGVRDSKEV